MRLNMYSHEYIVGKTKKGWAILYCHEILPGSTTGWERYWPGATKFPTLKKLLKCHTGLTVKQKPLTKEEIEELFIDLI